MNTNRTLFRRTAMAASVTAAALVLAACGGGSGSDAGGESHNGHDKSSSAPAENKKDGGQNKADVSFATGMIPHHRQAVEMSGLAGSRAGSSEVKGLAEEIEGAQGPEIKTMSGWLKSWGEKVPEDMSGMSHEDMGHGKGDDEGMAGMMTDKQMDGLKKSSGKEFDEQFLSMMVEHHEGAVEMAETEKKKGAYGPAKKLADEIITAQQTEIKKMNKLLGKS